MLDTTAALDGPVDGSLRALPPPALAQSQQVYDVRVELGGPASDEEVRAGLDAELGADPAGWLGELQPRIGTTAEGRAAVELKVPGHDVWTSALTAMAVLRQLDFDLLALHVESRLEPRAS